MKNKSLNLKTRTLLKKAVSLITAAVMVITILPLQPVTAYAEEQDTTVCTHHVHNEECGYVAPVDEVLCTHTHDESCGYTAAVEEVKCECTETDENGAVLHAENCGYIPASEEVPCAHAHDENCGYAAAVAGAPCCWTDKNCAECNPADDEIPSDDEALADETFTAEPVVECICETDDETIHAANCPLYTPVENPQCFCVEKCTEETLNYWCDVCGIQGVAVCQAAEEETAVVYAGYSYTDQHGTIHTVDNATEITADSTTWSDGWYYVNSAVTIQDRITVNGDVTLILGITARLEALQGIKVSGGNSLTIYGATANAGSLYAYSFLSSAAIGSDGNATIDDNGKIIISSDADTTLGTITINSGEVNTIAVADGNYSTSAAIGGGRYSKGGTININGGDVYAEAPSGWGKYAPAIGPGELSSGDVTINITGGTVTAKANYTAIGSGYNADCSLKLNISGGDIAAVSYETNTFLVTIGSAASSGNAEVNITGGIINAASIGSHLDKNVLTVKGGKFVQDPAASLPEGMYTVQGTDDLYTAHWSGAYIEGITQVDSISVTVNGILQTLTADNYKIIDGTLYIFVPNGIVIATVNGMNYVGNHTSLATKLEKYTKIDDLNISSTTINAGEPKEFTATVATPGVTAVKLEYKITDQGTTGAYISNGSTVCTDLDGEFKLTVTATDVFDQTYSETFNITSKIIAVTGISGDSAIPQSVNPSTLQLPTGVLPANASKTTVVWSVVSGSAVVSGNTARFIGAGTAVLRATVENGLGYGKDFTKDYSITVSAPAAYDLKEGNITFSKIDDSTMKIEYGAGYVTNVPMGTIVTITGTSDNTITVLSGVANFVLKDCVIGAEYSFPTDIIPVNISSGAKAEITLSDKNELKGRPAIHVPQDARLIIDGTGELYVESMYGSASIGGKSEENAGSITINGGTVNAKNGDSGATIGGGKDGSGGTITINGGTVTAENSNYGAAIGGGSNGSGGSITINGGTVNAENSYYGAAIGGGKDGSGGSITINGGTVNAENSRSSVAIGGAGGTGSITINGGTVTATGGKYGAGIGGSKESAGGSIIISDGTVTATGGQYGAGIGDGYQGTGGSIIISGGTITATGGQYGAGIGGGRSGKGGTININGGTVIATCGTHGAGIGGGYNGAGGNITISGGTVIATGDNLGAGIGGGYNGAGGDVVITGGNIKAVDMGSNFSIGAGSGSSDDGTLTDGTNSISMRTITLDGAAADTAVTEAVLPQGASYGVKDVKTLDTDKLYFYLPANTAVNTITAGTAEYICNRNNTYYTAHGTTGYADIKETTHDVVCSLCGSIFIDNANHQYGANDKCACGRDKHTHMWTYTADENTATITANCTAADCPNTNGGSVKITVADREYTGSAFEANVTDTLTTGDTYTVSYTAKAGSALTADKAVNEGEYTATLALGGESVSADFKITAKEITEDMVNISGDVLSYDGNAKTPAVTVTANGNTLAETTDYTVEYENNINATTDTSKATVTVKGTGNYKGTVSLDFDISKSEPEAELFVFTPPTEDLTYNGSAKTATVKVKDGVAGMGKVTVLYQKDGVNQTEAVNAGEYKVVISIQEGDNYTQYQGHLTSSDWKFTIKKADYDMSNVKWNRTTGEPFEFDGTEHTVELTGLPQGVTASYTENSKIATGTYIATAEFNYDSENYNTPAAIPSLEWYIEWNATENKDYTINSAGTPNSDGWYNRQIQIIPANGYIFYTNNDTSEEALITLNEDTADGSVTFRVYDSETLSMSYGKTVTYKLDTTAPTGTVTVEENSWTALLNSITFDKFFNKTVDVKVNATDITSGVKSVEYIESSEALTLDKLKQIANWTAMDADNKVSVTAEDAKQFVYYIRITDNADNMTIISSDGMVFDLTPPVISDITNGATYYTTQKFTVTEANLADVKVNDNAVTDYTLAGNVDATYKVVVTDKAGNSAIITVTMKPISALTGNIKDLTEADVTGDDTDAIKAAEEAITAVDTTNATQAEKDEIAEAQENIDRLQQVVEDTAAEVKALEDTLAGYDKDTVKSTDEAAVDQLIDDLTAKLDDANLSAEQKTDLTEALADAEELADKIDEDKVALEDAKDSIPAVDTDNTTDSDIENLEKAEEKLESILNDDNYTTEEKAEVQNKLDEIKDIADEIGSTYVITHGADGKWTKGSSKTLGFTANGLFKLFKKVRVDGNVLVKDTDYTASSGSTIVTLKQSYLDTLSVGKHKLEVVYDILGEEHIADCEFTIKAKPAPATQAIPAPTDNVPKTGDSTNTVGWTILMLSSMAALTVVFKKKKEYEDR